MNICVNGEVSTKCKPDKIDISIEFVFLRKEFSEALKIGTESVNEVINNVLKKIEIDKESLKTKRYNIISKAEYDEKLKEQVNLGYEYNQDTKFTMEYNTEKLGIFIEEMSKIKNPPKFYISFSVLDKEKIKNELLEKAYQNAKEKAIIIANASSKKIVECLEIKYDYFDGDISNVVFRDLDIPPFLRKTFISDSIAKTFVPEDIEFKETISCLWKAE